MSKRLRRLDQAMFARSYLLTIGLLMFAGASVVGYVVGKGSSDLEWWGLMGTSAIVLIGAALFTIGIFGHNSRMEGWADIASSHEASIILMVISYPVYLILKRLHHAR